MVTDDIILEHLNAIQFPIIDQSIVSLGFIKDIKIKNQSVSLTVQLPTPIFSLKNKLRRQIEESLTLLRLSRLSLLLSRLSRL